MLAQLGRNSEQSGLKSYFMETSTYLEIKVAGSAIPYNRLFTLLNLTVKWIKLPLLECFEFPSKDGEENRKFI